MNEIFNANYWLYRKETVTADLLNYNFYDNYTRDCNWRYTCVFVCECNYSYSRIFRQFNYLRARQYEFLIEDGIKWLQHLSAQPWIRESVGLRVNGWVYMYIVIEREQEHWTETDHRVSITRFARKNEILFCSLIKFLNKIIGCNANANQIN